jgi:hypothetical protein
MLAAIGAVQAMGACYGPMLLTRLGPRAVFKLVSVGAALTLPTFGITLAAAGLEWAILAWIAAAIVMQLVNARVLTRDLGGDWKPLLAELVRPSIAAAAMAAVLGSMNAALPAAIRPLPDLIHLALSVGVGVVVYVATVAALWVLAGRPRGSETDLLFVAISKLRRRR